MTFCLSWDKSKVSLSTLSAACSSFIGTLNAIGAFAISKASSLELRIWFEIEKGEAPRGSILRTMQA